MPNREPRPKAGLDRVRGARRTASFLERARGPWRVVVSEPSMAPSIEPGACLGRPSPAAAREAPAKLDPGGPNVARESGLRLGRRCPAGREGDQPVEPDVPVAADEIDSRLPGIPHRLAAGIDRETQRRR